MSDVTLPKGWASCELESLLAHVIGGDWGKDPSFEDPDFVEVACIRGSEFRHWDEQKGLTASIRKVKKSSLASRDLEVGDILVEISGGGPDQPVGRTVLIENCVLKQHSGMPVVCTNFLRLARPVSTIDSSYLNSYLRSFYLSGEVVNYQGGSNNLRNLKFKDYVTISIPLPPLAEQREIARRLDELLAQVDTLKTRLDAIPSILKRFRQSTLAAATSGKLTEQWRGTSALDGWERKTVIDVVESKPRNGNSPKGVDYETPYKNLTLSATTQGYFIEGCFKYVDIEIDGDSYLWVMPGDILIQRANSLEYVGVSAIYRGAERRYVYPDLMMKCRPNKSILGEYLHYCLLSQDVRKYFRDNATGTAGNMPKINQQTVCSAPIFRPPLKEQTEIVRRVEELFAFAGQVEQRVNNAQARVNHLTQSILAKAFRGELTEEWRTNNPDLITGENFAEALLNRIKSERATLTPKKKTRKKGAR